MPIPDYQMVMLPLLEMAVAKPIVSLKDARTHIAEIFKLTDDEIAAKLPSGGETVLRNRIGWARTFLKKAECLTYPSRGHFSLTPRGKEVAARGLPVDVSYLKSFPEFERNWQSKVEKGEVAQKPAILKDTPSTPRELFDSAHKAIKLACLSELKERLQTCSPGFFENVVVETVVAMGYGGSFEDAAQAVGRSGDGGIDGIIKEDRLGLDVIYLQAKRWEAKVGRPELQKFAGALQGRKAKKGIFITTSDFTEEAAQYVRDIDIKVILLSGEAFCDLMWQGGIGVDTLAKCEIKRLKIEYFEEE